MTIRKDTRTVLGILALVIAVAAFGLTLYLNGKQNGHRASDKRAEAIAKEESAKRVDPILCHLVYAYVHPVVGTDQTGRADQIDLAWQQIGGVVGCPLGIKP